MRIIQVIFLLLPVACSQPLHARMLVLEARSQSWSGGIAGRSGVNYTFRLQCPVAAASLHFDTLWIGNEPLPLKATPNGNENQNTVVKTNGKATEITIYARITHDQQGFSPATGNSKVVTQRPPIPYKGVALVTYKEQKKQKYLVIGRITSHLPTLSFP